MRKVRLCFLAGIVAFACGAYAFEAQDIVSPGVYAELAAQGEVHRSYYKKGDVQLALMPDTPLAKEVVNLWPKTGDQPVFLLENLYLLDKATLGDGDPSKMTVDYASKVIRSVSKMEGMQYYSHSDKKVKVLYKDCYRIAGPTDRTRLADDTEGSADGKVLYCMQNDSSFGKTNYQLSYRQEAEETSAAFINTTPIYAGIIRAVNTGNLRISLVISDCGDSFVVYMLVQAKFPALKSLEETMNDSFGSRLDAVYDWFVNQF